MSGLVYNAIRPLDLAAEKKDETEIIGDVRIVENIPFDYR
jgi:hypothetical protein